MSTQGPNSSPSQPIEGTKKRSPSIPSSARTKSTPRTRKALSVPTEKCVFCAKQTSKENPIRFPQMIRKALFSKYSSSQNYYYTKDINEILANAKTTKVIRFKDSQFYDESEEYLKRSYKHSEYNNKMKMLTEYYKFHKDIARMFMRPITDVVNRHHDKKRKIEYIRVTKMLREQNQGKGEKKSEKPKQEENKTKPLVDRVLIDLDSTQSETKVTRTGSKDVSKRIKTIDRSKLTTKEETNTKPSKEENKANNGQNNKKRPNDLSISNTIHELNLKLGEIISNTHSKTPNLDGISYFDTSQQHLNDTMSNLNNFLNYMKVNRQVTNLNEIPDIVPLAKLREHSTKSVSRAYTYRSQEISVKPFSQETPNKNSQGTPVPSIVKVILNKHLERGQESLESTRQQSISPDPLKRRAKIARLDEDGKNQTVERPISALMLTRLPAHSKDSIKTSKSRGIPTPSMKIQNFEEAFKIKQQGSLIKISSQRSTSRERTIQMPALNSSRKVSDHKTPLNREEDRPRDMPSLKQRRRSHVLSGDLSKSHSKTTTKEKSIYNIKNFQKAFDGNNDPSAYNVPHPNIPPNSNREMRISLDVNSIGRQPSHPDTMNNGNLTGGKTISVVSQKSGTSASTAGVVRIMSHKAMGSHNEIHASKGTPSHLNDTDSGLKTLKSIPTSTIKVKEFRSKSTIRDGHGEPKSSIPESTLLAIKQNVEQFYGKTTAQRDGRVSARHKLTKSEGKLSGLEIALAKKGSLPHPQSYRNYDQTGSRLSQEDESSATRPVYTYNQNNIVNIFMPPQQEKASSEPNSAFKRNIKRRTSEIGELPGGALVKPSHANQLVGQGEGNKGESIQKIENVGQQSRRDDVERSPPRIIPRDGLKNYKSSRSGSTFGSLHGIPTSTIKLSQKNL